jgi:hypothetical protein
MFLSIELQFARLQMLSNEGKTTAITSKTINKKSQAPGEVWSLGF